MTERRWAWAEIDLGAIRHNVRALKDLTRPGTGLMAVVKADGYGHGSVAVARTALAAGADRLGVATVDEALELRTAGIASPVHVLSEPPISAIDSVLDNDLIVAVYTEAFVDAAAERAHGRGTRLVCHLKIDTGMNRIGVRPADVAAFASHLRDLQGISLEGTFTHFATADVPDDWDVERQLERFEIALGQMRDEGLDPGIVHAANSPATILYSRAHFDMVRCGVALYGLHPSKHTRGRVDLAPALSVKARTTLVKRIGIGEGVSYGLAWSASGPCDIATLPLGYADGVHRCLSGKLPVLIGGERATQVGRICMDQMMVELPRRLTAARGDEVVLVGEQGSGSVTLDEIADLAGTINYEMACSFGMRLPRVYLG